jgi:hypothetical protein
MMNAVFTMLVATASGSVTEAYNFSTKAECEAAAFRLQVKAVCVEKKPVDVENQMRKMIQMMKAMQNEFDKDSVQQTP